MHPLLGLQVFQARELAYRLGFTDKLAGEAARQSEATVLARLEHPNIVPIFEVGRHEGQHYFSMGYIDGQSLAAKVARQPMEPREAAALVQAL